MVNVDSVRRLLAIADTVKDPYAVADVAGELLSAVAEDPVALAAYARALISLGLPQAAARLLTPQGSPVTASGNGGLVPWASRARRFSANLASLAKKDPTAASLVEQASAGLATLELHLANDGNFQVLDTALPIHRGWLTGFANHKSAEHLWPKDAGNGGILQPILFESLGFGWLFLHGLQRTEKTFLQYRCPFYVLEPDPLALAIAMHVHDLRDIFSAPRVRFFVSAGAGATLEQFRAAVLSNPHWTLPGTIVRNPLRLPRMMEIDAVLAELRETRKTRENILRAAITDYYAGKTVDHWRDRFADVRDNPATSHPLRVLGITSRYTTVLQHSMAELQQAVRAVGNAEMRVAIEPNDESLENPLLDMIADFQPDLIVQISRMRYEHASLPANVPFLCWDQDNLPCMRTPQATASLDALTFVAGHGAVFGYANLNWPRGNMIFCHAAGASHRYHAGPVAVTLREINECDFSYVSNASGSPESMASQMRRGLDATRRPLFDDLAEKITSYSHAGRTYDYISVQRMVRETAATRGLDLPANASHDLAMDLHRLGDRCFRHATLQWVSRFCLAHGKTLRLFGQGWESHPDFHHWAAGVAEPGENTRAIYQASRINLQIIESGFIHSRALDGVAAGGFFLTRRPLVFGVDPAEEMTLYRLATWARENRAFDERQIARLAPPHINAWLHQTQTYFDRHGLRWALGRSLEIWAELPPPAAAIPHMDDVMFADEASFVSAATRFLTDENCRRVIAYDMRKAVLASFSYDARWKLFLESITHHLESSSSSSARPPESTLAGAAQ